MRIELKRVGDYFVADIEIDEPLIVHPSLTVAELFEAIEEYEEAVAE